MLLQRLQKLQLQRLKLQKKQLQRYCCYLSITVFPKDRQVKIMKYYFSLQKFTKLIKPRAGTGENGNFPILLVGPHVGTLGNHVPKSGNATCGLFFGQAIPLSGIKSGKTSTRLHKETCTRLLKYYNVLKQRNRRMGRPAHIPRT